MTLAIVSNTVALLLAFIFLLAGFAHIIGLNTLRSIYRRWRLAGSFRYVAGVIQLFTALFLAIPQTRFWGGALAAFILFTMVVSLLNHGKYLYAIPAILIMFALLPAIASPI